jgi:hypothetical protein
LQQLETIDSRQANIEHDEVEWSLANLVQRGFATINCGRIVTALGQCRGDLPRHGDFIFNNQDSHGYVWNIGGLKPHGKLRGQQVIVVVRSSGFMLKTVLQF